MFQLLVIDDDKNTRRLLKAVLETENYTVLTAENGVDALGVMDREHVDLIVLDIMMPQIAFRLLTKFDHMVRRKNKLNRNKKDQPGKDLVVCCPAVFSQRLYCGRWCAAAYPLMRTAR